jgi:hypothetical protein
MLGTLPEITVLVWAIVGLPDVDDHPALCIRLHPQGRRAEPREKAASRHQSQHPPDRDPHSGHIHK